MRQNTQVQFEAAALIGRYTRVVKHWGRVGERFGTVRDIFWKGDEPCVVLLLLPSQKQIVVPVCWTDLPPVSLRSSPQLPQLSAAGLVTMVEYCRGMKSRGRSRAPRSKTKKR